MNRYRCYLLGEENDVTEVTEIAADFDVKAVLLARAAAIRAGYRRFEVWQAERVVRREGLPLAAG